MLILINMNKFVLEAILEPNTVQLLLLKNEKFHLKKIKEKKIPKRKIFC
jgi:hypothetical protein